MNPLKGGQNENTVDSKFGKLAQDGCQLYPYHMSGYYPLHIKFIIALISATKICCQKKNSFFSNLKGKLNKYILLNISYPNNIIIINENLVIFSHVIKNAIMKV